VFAAWGSWVARFRWPVLAFAIIAVTAAGVWGLGVFGQLSEGGYNDPGSESSRAAAVVQEALGAQSGDVVVIYTPTTGTIDDAGLSRRIETRLAALPKASVPAVASYWPDKTEQYRSADGSSAVAVLTLAGDDDGEKLESYQEIDGKLTVEGATARFAGGAPLADASTTLSTQDLAFAEAISLPIVLILLLFIFGSLVAASLPVLVGGCAVLGSLGVLHAVAASHDVNSFAVNVASLLGLGMAIDYGLFIVGRFREEQAAGRTTPEAVTRAVATAGRTVAFSATLLMIALGGLLLFPQGFLKSLAYGGLAAVALAALLSLTLLPALLAVLGPRVDKLPVRLPRRNRARPAGTGWARLAGAVLRRPVLVALPILAGLLVLAAPIAGVQFGEQDERVLPAANPARQAVETLKTDFPALSSAGIQVVLRGGPPSPTTFLEAIKKVPGIAAVTPAGAGGDVRVFTATLKDKDPFSPAARDAVEAIRALAASPGSSGLSGASGASGAEVLVGGATARNVDSLSATADRLPLMVALLVGATLVLMFLAFGSILLPIKAVVMSALSLSATFGILVWIFQDGHGAGLLQITPAPLEAGIVVLMAAVVFGLSTDYEVFLLSRMVEARTRGASTAEAVTTGLARTGRVISAAAILLIVVTGAFALSSVTTMRFVGVGMIIALLLDATVVRMLLVPAVLKLMGNAAWWSPGPLRRLQEKAGLAEYEDEELFPTVSVGRHAAPESAAARSSTAAPRHASWYDPPASEAYSGAAAFAIDTPASSRARPDAGPAAPVSPASGLPVSPASGSPVSPGSGLPVAGSAPVPSGDRITLDDPSARLGRAGPAAAGTASEQADSTEATQVYEWPEGTADSPIHDAVVGSPAASPTPPVEPPARPVSGAPPSWPPAARPVAATETVESSPGWPSASPGPADDPATTATGWPADTATEAGDDTAGGDETAGGDDTGPLETRSTVNLAGRLEPRGTAEPHGDRELPGSPEPGDDFVPPRGGSVPSRQDSPPSSAGSVPSRNGPGDGEDAPSDPETTAVIEVGPTVDLADRLPEKAEPGSQ
jgi:uncharacterized membrane protein YdfJ with MMPL/SSD domain